MREADNAPKNNNGKHMENPDLLILDEPMNGHIKLYSVFILKLSRAQYFIIERFYNGASVITGAKADKRSRLSIKPHLRRHRRARQAKSLAVTPVPSIWGFLDSLNIDFFYRLADIILISV